MQTRIFGAKETGNRAAEAGGAQRQLDRCGQHGRVGIGLLHESP
jgi:hypothetical protein